MNVRVIGMVNVNARFIVSGIISIMRSVMNMISVSLIRILIIMAMVKASARVIIFGYNYCYC